MAKIKHKLPTFILISLYEGRRHYSKIILCFISLFLVSDEQTILKILPFSLMPRMKNCIDNILAKIKNAKSAKFAICSSDLNVVAFSFLHFSLSCQHEQTIFKILPFSFMMLMKNCIDNILAEIKKCEVSKIHDTLTRSECCDI